MSTVRGAAKCLVVVELGASCPAFVSEMRPECVVQEQRPDEPGAAFAERVAGAIRDLTGTRIALVVLVHSEQAGDSEARRRRALCTADALAASGEGELLLMATPGAGDPLRGELFELAELLCERLVGTAVGVRVRFSELESGVASARPVAEPNPSARNGK